MKRTILALLLLASSGSFLYACTGDDSATSGGDDDTDSAAGDGSTGNDGSFVSDSATPTDSGVDAGLGSTSLQIMAVKNAAPATPDGGEVPSAVTLPIDHALVTYVRPAVLPDPAGFFLQAEQTGPAVFVAIDPTTLSTPPVAGDDVSMTVTSVGNVVSLHEVLAVTGFTVNSHGHSIAGLLRSVSSATDLVSKLDDYESEYISLDGFVASNFGNSGGSKSAEIVTTAVSSPTSGLELRIPPAVQTFFDLENTCQFSLKGIMWRFGKGAEPSGWENADLTVSCNAPQVVSAIATSATTVNVAFDRDMAASSIMANGSQFAITDSSDAGVGAAVSGAVLGTDLRTVTLTTSPQTAGQTLKVVVTSTVEDVLSKPIDTAHNTADFLGFVTPAVLQLNELNPNISVAGQHDLIELTVVTGGDLVGIQLWENIVSSNKVLLATLPSLQVATGDIVVVHLDADLADGGVNLITNETTTKGDCVLAACYPNAWDVSDTAHSTAGLTYGSRVIAIKSPSGALVDGISWFKSGTTLSGTYYTDTNALIDAGLWENCGASQYCDSADAAALISVNANGSGNTAAGPSVARIGATNTHSTADWELADAGSFGAVNP